MARRISTLLLIAGAFVVMTGCDRLPELCEHFPEACDFGGFQSDQADSGSQPDPAPQLEAEPDLAEVDPEEGRT